MRLIQYTYPTTAARFTPALGYGRSPWTGLENEIDRLFNTALTGFAGRANGNQFPVDLYEDKDNTYVRAELPGVAKDDVNVEIAEGVLTVTAARKQKRGDNEENVSFSRSLTLPEDVQADRVAATLENGVLTVTLPKREEAKPRKVAIDVK